MRTSSFPPQSIELIENPRMDRIRNYFQSTPAYEPIENEHEHDNEADLRDVDDEGTGTETDYEEGGTPFAWVEYGVFLLLGVAMLWAWNMFMAAAPYFHGRFKTSDWIVNHFQPAEVSVSTVTNLGFMLLLSKLQENASYPRRITLALIISAASFTLMALSTLFQTSAKMYFGFLMLMVFFSSMGTGLIQNGVFAFAAGFGRSEYIQAIMAGQGVAGVLPPLVQIISVAAMPDKKNHITTDSIDNSPSQSPRSAFVYFITAVGISVLALVAFLYLLRRTSQNDGLREPHKPTPGDEPLTNSSAGKPSVPLLTLFRKLTFLSLSVFLCFTVTMVFPVFTASISSSSGMNSAIFIPLAFLVWNIGDLAGRVVTIAPQISLTYYPFALFCLAMARLLFIPLYFLCNIKGRGAVVNSDVFYLVVVQFLFGLSNGYLGSQCMMGAGDWVLPEEREAAGGFMGLMLVGGLTAGSLLSFLLGDI